LDEVREIRLVGVDEMLELRDIISQLLSVTMYLSVRDTMGRLFDDSRAQPSLDVFLDFYHHMVDYLCS